MIPFIRTARHYGIPRREWDDPHKPRFWMWVAAGVVWAVFAMAVSVILEMVISVTCRLVGG